MTRLYKILIGSFVILFGLWLYGFIWYAQKIPGEVKDETTITDAIIVLTGGKNRLQAGLELLGQEKAQKMFISGVHKHVTCKELGEFMNNWPQEYKDKITLGYNALDTHENSLESAEWVEQQHIRSLRLVTSGYHMRRSLFEFRNTMPWIKIVPHPVFSDNVQQKQWWRFGGTALLILSEYSKYLYAQILNLPQKIGFYI
jgi:uncharacterized SAM-binding protein YcdF (DUF218 family)